LSFKTGPAEQACYPTLCAWVNPGNTRPKKAATYLTLDIMKHLLARKVEHPTSLSQRNLILGDKEWKRSACIKRYDGKKERKSGLMAISGAFRVMPQSPIARLFRHGENNEVA
jgi:hypothetical protein